MHQTFAATAFLLSSSKTTQCVIWGLDDYKVLTYNSADF